jgi:hypothetical protein
VDSSVAAMYDLPTVQVENHAGSFVAPTPPSLGAALRDMGTNPDGVTRFPRFTRDDSAAYPLPVVTYLVAQTSVTKAFDGTEADVLRTFIRAAASVGAPGRSGIGGRARLPDGYAPLPSSMTSDARSAATALPTRNYTPPPPPPSSTGTGTGTGTGGFPGGSGPGGNPSQNPFGSGSGTTSQPPTTTSPSSSSTIGAIPPYSLTSAKGGYVWPVVLITGLGLLVFGTLLSLALGIASRRGAKQALAAAEGAKGNAPAGPEIGG